MNRKWYYELEWALLVQDLLLIDSCYTICNSYKYHKSNFQLNLNDKFICTKLMLKDSSPFGHLLPLPPVSKRYQHHKEPMFLYIVYIHIFYFKNSLFSPAFVIIFLMEGPLILVDYGNIFWNFPWRYKKISEWFHSSFQWLKHAK